jgi:subtilisin
VRDQFRYGVAHGADIFIGKVLGNDGSGEDSTVFAGIEWALANKCHIISMSLGSEVLPGESYYDAYETVAKRALAANCIIIAAAGNDSVRSSNIIKSVNHPANCPSIMAVGAVDNQLKVADFSCAGTRSRGGQIDIAAPGVDIISSWKKGGYMSESGTSMATPFVAGIAALLWEEDKKMSASDIWMRLTQAAKRLPGRNADVGSGLAFFP